MQRSLPLLSLWRIIDSLSLTCLGLLAGQERALCGPVGGSFLTAHLSVYTEVWGNIRTFSSGLDLPLWLACLLS